VNTNGDGAMEVVVAERSERGGRRERKMMNTMAGFMSFCNFFYLFNYVNEKQIWWRNMVVPLVLLPHLADDIFICHGFRRRR
jgi:hypothetical protein